MNNFLLLLHRAVTTLVMGSWFLLLVALLFRKRPTAAKQQRHDRKSLAGLFLQFIGYTSVWAWRRPRFTAFVAMPSFLDILLGCLTIFATLGSGWLLIWAVRTLGQHFNLTAQLLEGHRLVTEGPYRWVRHPIYTAMMGLLLATGLSISQPLGLALGLVIYIVGTIIRIRIEDQLLCEAFGQEFNDFAKRVPAVIPGIW